MYFSWAARGWRHAQEIPREHKLALLGLQFQGLAPAELEAALDGESGSLEDAAALLQFYAEEVLLPTPLGAVHLFHSAVTARSV